MKITPASRSLVMVYWLVLLGYAYGLGLGLRLVTPYLDALIFMLLVVGSIIMVPILMLLGVVLYVFPSASPTIWRDIRVPFGCFWFGVVMQVWFLPDANFYEDYTHPMVVPLSAIFRVSPTVCHYVLAIVFFGLCAASYGRILIVGRQAPRVDAPVAPVRRASSVVVPGRSPASIRAWRTQPRRVSGLTPSSDLSCTVWGGFVFWVGFFVGMVPVGWSSWGTKPAVGFVG